MILKELRVKGEEFPLGLFASRGLHSIKLQGNRTGTLLAAALGKTAAYKQANVCLETPTASGLS